MGMKTPIAGVPWRTPAENKEGKSFKTILFLNNIEKENLFQKKNHDANL